jgi:hypothetical protein
VELPSGLKGCAAGATCISLSHKCLIAVLLKNNHYSADTACTMKGLLITFDLGIYQGN